MTTAIRKCMHIKRAKQCVNTWIITCAEVPYSSKKMKRILPYFIIPSTFSPQASSPLSHHRQTEKFQHPFHPSFFLFSTERAGPYPQAQLYWDGRTMGWMAD